MDRTIPNKPHRTPDPEKPHAGKHDRSSVARPVPGLHGTSEPSPEELAEAEAVDGEPTFDSCFDDLNLVLSQSMQQPDPDPNLGCAGEGPSADGDDVPESGKSPKPRGRTPRTWEIFRTILAGSGDPPASAGLDRPSAAGERASNEAPMPDLGVVDRPAGSVVPATPEARHPEASIPWGQILLLSYSSVLTLALIWMFGTGRVPRAAAPSSPAEPAPADPSPLESASGPGEPAPESPAPPLPPENIAAIGKTIRLGDLEVTPMAVQAGPVELVRAIAPRKRRTEDGCLILRLRLTNRSAQHEFSPLDQDLVRDRDLRMFDPYIATADGRSIRLFPLALDSEWSIRGQDFPILRPGESAETFIAAEPNSAARVTDEMTWRVPLRIGVYRSDLLGVRFTRGDVRRVRRSSWDDEE
jgi:hypothetical protein